MYKVLLVVLLVKTCLGLIRDGIIGPNSNLLLNTNRHAYEQLNWKPPVSEEGDQAILLNFDDIPTPNGQAAIALYKGLLFEGLTVVNVSSNSSVLDDEDRDCATSLPNTLVSFSSNDTKIPLIKIGAPKPSDGTSPALFDIVSFSIKPRLKRGADPFLIQYTFWRYTDAVKLYQVFFGDGHRAVTHLDWESYNYNLTGLFAIEISVLEDRKQDFDFCLDDLSVRIHNAPNKGDPE